MIRSLLRPVKRWVLRHAGITPLTESVAHLQSELGNVQTHQHGQGQTLLRLLEWKTLLEGQADVLRRLEEWQALLEGQADALRRLEEWKTPLERQADALRRLDELPALRDGQGQVLHELRALLDRQPQTEQRLEAVHARLDEHARVLGQLADVQIQLGEQTHALHRLAEALPGAVGELRQALEQSTAELQQQSQEQSAAEIQKHLGEQIQSLRAESASRLDALTSRLEKMDALGDGLRSVEQRVAAVQTALGEVYSWGLDRWKVQEHEGLLRFLRRVHYETAIRDGSLEVPVLQTEHPIAVHSDDVRFPWGAKNDNSICPKFNVKLYQLFPAGKRLKVLDLGCAGGGFVRSLIDDGHLAVGLDGCDYPKVHRHGEWATIPRHLHNCDITHPFSIQEEHSGSLLRFDVITAWEVMEHIRDEDLEVLCRNILNHLACDGLFLCSVSTIEDGNPELGAVYHVTIQPRAWWVERLGRLGFEVVEQQAIGKDDWLRGAGNCRLDRRAEDEGIGFHLVLRRRAAAARAAA